MDPITAQLMQSVVNALDTMNKNGEMLSPSALTLILSGYGMLGIFMLLVVRYLLKIHTQKDKDHKEVIEKKDAELKEVNNRFQERLEVLTDKHIKAINDNISNLQITGTAITQLSVNTNALTEEVRSALELIRDSLDKSVQRLEQTIRDIKK